ncbi:MAG: transcriptional regulator, partial [Mesorhizobium sp.]
MAPNFIICLEDRRHFKLLKRHIAVHYGLSP